MKDELFHDVKAATEVGALVPATPTPTPDLSKLPVAAMERGTRHRPDGTVEEYERLEFARRVRTMRKR